MCSNCYCRSYVKTFIELEFLLYMALLVGTAGIPESTKKSGIVNGIKRCKELGLTANEIEFVRNIYMTPEVAKNVKKEGLTLTVHAPYYINLNSAKEEVVKASIRRIVKSAKIGKIAGAKSVTFHAAYYGGKEPEEVYEIVKNALINITDEVKGIRISPETAGKVSQFGSLIEILQLSKELKGVFPCIDFAHLHARTGKFNSKKEFDKIFDTIKDYLGNLKNLHMHISGINYTSKGERNHLQLPKSDFKLNEWIKSLKENRVDGIIIAESPSPEKDALLIKRLL